MLGKLLSLGVQTIKLPLSAVNVVADVATGGNGKRSSRKEIPVLGDLEELADDASEALEELDD